MAEVKDYISQGFLVVRPDAAFPGLRVGTAPVPLWSRWWIAHNRYADLNAPSQVFLTRDEASILHNAALQFQGRRCLQVGGGQDWSGVHIALGSYSLDLVDTAFQDSTVAQRVQEQFQAAGIGDAAAFHQQLLGRETASSRNGPWGLIFLHASHEDEASRNQVSRLAEIAADDCMVFVSNLVSPRNAAAFRQFRGAGWHSKLFQTAEIMGVAWRGNVEPPAHVPDPDVAWTLPRHLSDWPIAENPHSLGSVEHERQLAFAQHAQAAQDEIIAQQIAFETLRARLKHLESRQPEPEDSWSLKEAVGRRVKRHSLQLWMGLRRSLGRIPPIGGGDTHGPHGKVLNGVGTVPIVSSHAESAPDLLAPLIERIQRHHYPKLTKAQQVAVDGRLSLGRNALAELAAQVRQTELLDETAYRATAELQDDSMDAALHYVIVGEIAGFAPSSLFDPRYYARRNPDVGNSGMVLVVHYATAGRGEKRLPVAPEMKHVNPERFSPARENVIVVVHEASRTGAPILGWNIVEQLSSTYNVFSICLGDGPLVPEFQAVSTETYGPFARGQNHWVDLDESLRDLFCGRTFRYAIVNSTESRPIIDVFVKRFIPTFFLVHEYAFYVFPPDDLRRAFNLSTEVIFPTRGVAMAAREVHPPLADRPLRIIPQGRSLIPSSNAKKKPGKNKALEAVLAKQAEGQFIVLGAGSVQLRKGVDLFLAAAAAVAKRRPKRPIHFAWVGHGYRPDEDMGYSIYLREQFRRSGLEGGMTFVDEVADMQPLYRASDVMLLTSRLDPLPNVSIDAACEGIPVICFRDASGTADIMSEHADTALSVVPHLDADAAAEVLVKLSSDQASYDALASATKTLGTEIFDMGRYAAQLDALWPACDARMEALRSQQDLLVRNPRFDMTYFLEPGEQMTRSEAVARYLTAASLPGFDMAERRPAPGFNGNLYREAHPDLPLWKSAFASYVEHKCPPGPWQLDVLTPDIEHTAKHAATALRCCLYIARAENRTIDDILTRLALNHHTCDLVISIDDENKMDLLRERTADYRKGRVQLVVREGRTEHADFPVLMASMAQYDIIGCMDGKATSADPDTSLDRASLIGNKHGMMDLILRAFAEQPDLGLVFTANPKCHSFDAAQHRSIENRARLLNLEKPSRSYDFPQAATFWVRNTVLERLEAAEPSKGLDDETKPYDVLQRVLPIAANTLGVRTAVVHVPEPVQ